MKPLQIKSNMSKKMDKSTVIKKAQWWLKVAVKLAKLKAKNSSLIGKSTKTYAKAKIRKTTVEIRKLWLNSKK